jgi:type II secretory ATPase GspE/PulE/Tfp pilus assembly ATPase PilB-like protein
MMEVLTVDETIREAIVRGMPTAELRTLAVKQGMIPLKDVGLMKVRDGITSLGAALEVTGGE